MAANLHMITQKYVSFLANNFTLNNYLVENKFLWRTLCLSTEKYLNYKPHILKNPHSHLIIYVIKPWTNAVCKAVFGVPQETWDPL